MTLTSIEKAEADQTVIDARLASIQAQLSATSTPWTETTLDGLMQRTISLETELTEVYRKILHAIKSSTAVIDPSPHTAKYNTAMTQVYQIVNDINTKKAAIPKASSHTPPPHSGGGPAHPPPAQDFRLPRLQIPTFDGDLNEWITFRDMFLAAVDSKTNLSKIEKLTYLKSLLGGEAARQIKNFSLTDANYDIAWQALIDRYHNEREQLFSVLKKLFNQTATNPTSGASMRSLVDNTKSCIRSFNLLKGDINHLFLYIIFTKLDPTTKELWFQVHNSSNVPTLDNMYTFLEQRSLAVTAGGTTSRTRHEKSHSHHLRPTSNCNLCKSPHPLYKCPEFLKMSVTQRRDHQKKVNICQNCLQDGHSTGSCRSSFTCRTCGNKHHTLLHNPNWGKPKADNKSPATGEHEVKETKNNHLASQANSAIIATAVIRITGRNGSQHLVRAMLDSGSESSFITAACTRKLGFPVSHTATEVVGLSEAPITSAVGVTTIVVVPHFHSEVKYTVDTLVVNKITTRLPSSTLPSTEWSHLHNIELADPQFHTPGYIDVLLGSDVFWNLLGNEKRCGSTGEPLAIKSTLGWLVAGSVKKQLQVKTQSFMITNAQLHDQLEKFFQSEKITSENPVPTTHLLPNQSELTSDEAKCEEIFTNNYVQDLKGTFTVPIPWKTPRPEIGSSKGLALRRLQQMERRLRSNNLPRGEASKMKNEECKKEYIKFMREYLHLGHMSPVPEAECTNPRNSVFYIPHHFVLKMDSSTTKFRVVFDGSAKSSTGISLNDAMLVGPTVQSSLQDILLRFRTYPVVFTADIEKMYRQVKLKPQDADMHRILWREDSSQPVQEFRLNTVTYGTASAPYLATRCLVQLAENKKKEFPLAAAITKKGFYVDDLMSGAKSPTAAKEVVSQLIPFAESGGFPLRKWTSNSQEVLESIPVNLREAKELIPLDEDSTVKTLGIFWSPANDVYRFKIKLPDEPTGNYTKRIVLSEMSQLFDPLGWLAPVTIKGKILMQEIWKVTDEWDTPLPSTIQEQWKQHKSTLVELEPLEIPRYVFANNYKQSQLIGFSDASERAIAAVVYVYSTDEAGNSKMTLLTSKTRVAPVKSVTLPRLELNAALLLAELISSVQSTLEDPSPVQLFTDSTIVLAWIHSDPNRWKTYVRNRICKLQSLTSPSVWYHVPGKENPADCASRGLLANELTNFHLWWNGNSNIMKSTKQVQTADLSIVKNEEKTQVTVHHSKTDNEYSFLKHFSSWKKLQRFVALLLRAQTNFKARKEGHDPLTDNITSDELNSARLCILKLVQSVEFSNEISTLKDGKELHSNNKLLSLSPFIDANGLLRVGGRLKLSQLPEDQKHPYLLPRRHHVTKLIIEEIHYNNFHAGPQLTLANLNQQYWIVRGKDIVRYAIKRCVICAKHRPKLLSQVMGDLPAARVTPAPPFEKCGVDYAGPFILRNSGRSKITFKAYLAIFICFVTRAIHIEIASSLSTEAFMSAFKKFISRRGTPTDVYSDCGTNFQGANKLLKSLFSSKEKGSVADKVAEKGVRWHFNPPSAPHFGGLWEAGVKSVKFHLFRVIGSTPLTYEELDTLAIQIEGILNSRPLTPISTDPNDLEVLTPAHFLIGRPLTGLPEPDLTRLNVGRLDRWQLIQTKQQTFWKRWSNEFVSRLQQRPKWMKMTRSIQLNDIVIIKEDNLPPAKWKLGRVIELHPGKDNSIRVVTLRTCTGNIKRPIHKLSLLPIIDEC